MRIDILPEAREDLLSGFRFYERQARGLGKYFLDSLLEDIDLLSIHGEAFTGEFSDITAVWVSGFPSRFDKGKSRR